MTGKPTSRGRKATRMKVEPKSRVVRVRRGAAARVKSSSPSSTTTSAGSTSSGCQENVPTDTSTINHPYDIRFNGVSSLLNVIHNATPEVKDLLMDECEIILECRICRNLFRSFPNFLCHKQQFCQQQYSPASQPKYGSLVQCAENLYQLQYHIDAFQRYSGSDTVVSDKSNIGGNQNNQLEMEHQDQTNQSEIQSRVQNNRMEKKCREIRLNKILSKLEHRSMSKLPYELKPSRNKRKLTLPCKSTCDGNEPATVTASLDPQIELSIEPLLNRTKDGIAFQRVLKSENDINCGENVKSVNAEDTAILGINGKMVFLGAEKGAQMFLNEAVRENDEYEMYNNLSDLQCSLCQTQFYSEKTLRLHARKSSCMTARKRSKVLNNGKRELLDLTGYKTDVPSLRNNSKITIHPSPVKNLIVKRTTTNSRVDCNTAKENKSIIRSIFGPKKSPSKSSKTMSSPVKSETTIVRALEKAQLAASYHSRINYGEKSAQQSCSSAAYFTCVKCSSGFATKCEMSTHLALCTGVINLAFQKRRGPPEQKKICIEIRHNYEKEQRASHPHPIPNETPQIRQNSTASSAGQTDRISAHNNIPFNNNLNETKPSGGDSDSDNVLQVKRTKELHVEKSSELLPS